MEVLVVSKRSSQFVAFFLVLAFAAIPAFAGPVPSKTAADQSIDQRAADLALVRDVAANEQVAKVLTDVDFTKEQVEQRLAQLSPQDLHQLLEIVDEQQSAAQTGEEWIWIGIG